ncbi:GNAT family N-acetyltransferase [Pantoea cypripedii]|uniref:GNAT family N-acetyltransferase n=1 Tax=Pantoea cypripedii TaxID=55209 RepID=A0A6B9GHU5_PANCY|nr:GNAT family N-acetyltransferase [Pantoea cypripedii]QGY33056.1 GNAT family N-acetyltransferase [Pantoea cypripedii]
MKIEGITVADCLILRQAVLWPASELAQCQVEGDEEASHYGIVLQDQIVSCLSVFFVDCETCQIRKFATLQQHQGKGYGTALMHAVLAKLSELSIQHVFLDARTSSTSFYRNVGFTAEGDAFMKNNIEYIRMNFDKDRL